MEQGKIPDWLWRFIWKDWVTWIGHALVGVVIGLLADLFRVGGSGAVHYQAAAFALLFFYGVREAPGIARAAMDDDLVKLRDGLFDLAFPILGLCFYLLVKQTIS